MDIQVNLLNIFPGFVPSDEETRLFSETKVEQFTLDTENRTVYAEFSSEKYIPQNDLLRFSDSLAGAYCMKSVTFSPHYPAALLPQMETKVLEDILIYEYPPAISILAGSKWTYHDGKYTVQLRANGKAEIAQHIDCVLRYVQEHFGTSVQIEFLRGDELDKQGLFEETEKMRAQAYAELPKMPLVPRESKAPVNTEEADCLYGKRIMGENSPISDLSLDMFKATVQGEVFNIDHKELKKRNAWVIRFDISDYTGSIRVSRFMEAKESEAIRASVKTGMWVRVQGKMTFDHFDNETVLQPAAIMKAQKPTRRDACEKGKRVELHLHTQMSSMDALTKTADAVALAAKWGHQAIGITDHGVAQSFPDAMKAAEKSFVAGTEAPIKILYGCEAYYFNDMDTASAVKGKQDIPLDGEYVAFDLETTGLNSRNDAIIEFGAAIFKGKEVIGEFKEFVNPRMPLHPRISELTGIHDEDLKDAPGIEEILPRFLAFCGDRPLLAHNADFDIGFLKAACRNAGIAYNPTYVDTLVLAQCLLPELQKHKLNIVAAHLSLPEFHHHRALDDALTAGCMMERFSGMLEEKGIKTLQEINAYLAKISNAKNQKKRSNHMLIFAKNQLGLRNLYHLISNAHLEHYYRNPRIPKSDLVQMREGLIIGSACEAGELFRAVVDGKSHDELIEIASFYDFLEIQPLANNLFMIEKGLAKNEEQLREFNRTVVLLGEELQKPVVATGDVHFLNPEDEIFRKILLGVKGMEGAERELPLYFRTTDEMLEEFSYLGEEKAYEVVVTNTNLIADMCETLRPVPHNLFAPKIENSVEDLKNLVYGKFHRLYGENPPELMQKRVDTEMNDIISCHYDVIYMSAQKLVQNSLENGYLVGSRGSVGSSIVAFLSGITEVNSFPPHYRCPKCKFTTFDVPEGCACGADLPDRVCPKCGANMAKDGFNIPFETFLGFGGDKVPDIDLNFSGEYQANAHAYCVEMFGKSHVFRAGTISTVAEKTAHGYVKNFMESHNKNVSKIEENRLSIGCSGVKRTTGQHPGGLVVIPQENEIWDFCPVQHPADDTSDDAWITTHFEYHSMEENLLKLDMLGHDDPTMIRMLQDMTQIDPQSIPLDDKDTMSIFTSSKVLGYENDKLLGPTGAVAIPEFGTRNARNMLEETKPDQFDVLVRLSGFSHGTDVWHGNARDLVLSGTAKVNEAIGCRDDIMLYLISKGMNEKRAFKFMEAVRKGAIHKGKKWPENIVEDMRALNVPEWYIESCRKIQYLFPKAHAVAYVMMAFRIAWYKVHEPLAFYSAYFYRRSQKDGFDAAMMTKGIDRVIAEIRRIDSLPDVTAKEEDLLTTLEVCYEFYLRGFSFAPIDLYQSDATKFNIVGNELLPPFVAVSGLGRTAAEDIVNGRKGKEFLSVEEFSLACPKVSKTHIENLREAGAFGSLPDSNQITLF